MVFVGIFAGSEYLATTIITIMVFVGIFTSSIYLIATVVAIMVFISILASTKYLVTTVITVMVFISIYASAKCFVTTVVAIMVFVGIFTCTLCHIASIVTDMILICILMSGCRNRFTCCQLFFTNQTIGITGITILCTAFFRFITKLCLSTMLTGCSGNGYRHTFGLVVACIRTGINRHCIAYYTYLKSSFTILPCPACRQICLAHSIGSIRNVQRTLRLIRCCRCLVHRNLCCGFHCLIIHAVRRGKYHLKCCGIRISHNGFHCGILP